MLSGEMINGRTLCVRPQGRGALLRSSLHSGRDGEALASEVPLVFNDLPSVSM
jgi:hypothetical protein